MGSHREGGSPASLFTSPLSLSLPPSPLKALQPHVLLVLETQSALFLKLTQVLVESVGFLVWCIFFFLNTHISAYISKQNLDLSVGGINDWKACQLLLNSKAAKLKLVKIFF